MKNNIFLATVFGLSIFSLSAVNSEPKSRFEGIKDNISSLTKDVWSGTKNFTSKTWSGTRSVSHRAGTVLDKSSGTVMESNKDVSSYTKTNQVIPVKDNKGKEIPIKYATEDENRPACLDDKKVSCTQDNLGRLSKQLDYDEDVLLNKERKVVLAAVTTAIVWWHRKAIWNFIGDRAADVADFAGSVVGWLKGPSKVDTQSTLTSKVENKK